MKKCMAILLTAALAAGMIGCGSSKEALMAAISEDLGRVSGTAEETETLGEAEAVTEAEEAEAVEEAEEVTQAEADEVEEVTQAEEEEAEEVPEEVEEIEEVPEEVEEIEEVPEEVTEAEAVTFLIPAVGEEISGFNVDSASFLEDGSQLVTLTHAESGASVIYIAADSEDMAAEFFVRTPATDDSGIAHVLEHLVLSGAAPPLYYTDIESAVYQHVTEYGAVSLSGEELLTAFTYLLDSLSDPVGLSDELYLRELARYELSSPESELVYTGDMVEELREKEEDPGNQARVQAMKLLYPYSTMSYNVSGSTDTVADIGMEELAAYFDEYYNPADMLTLLYGPLDIARYLELLDEALRGHEATPRIDEDSDFVTWEGYRKASLEYPTLTGDGSSHVIYAISMRGLSFYERELMDELSSILMQEKSQLCEAVGEAFPGSTFATYVYNEYAVPVWSFEISGDMIDPELFQRTVDTAIELIAGEGIDQVLIDGYINRMKLRAETSAEEMEGHETATALGLIWGAGGSSSDYLDMLSARSSIREEADAGTLDTLLCDYILYPDTSVLLTLTPVEAMEDEETDPLDSMSIREIASLVGETARFHAWKELMSVYDIAYASEVTEPDAALPGDDKGVDMSELYVQSFELEDVESYVYEIEDAGYLGADLYLDAGVLDFDEIHDFVLLGKLLGRLATAESTPEELDGRLFALGSSLNFTPEVMYDTFSGDAHPYLGVHLSALSDKIEDTFALMGEILLETDLSDTEGVKTLAAEEAEELREYLDEGGAELAARAAEDPDLLYEYYAFSDEYLGYLESVAGYGQNKLKRLCVRLEAVRDKLCQRGGLMYAASGSEETLAEGFDELKIIVGEFGEEELEQVDYGEELGRFVPEVPALSGRDKDEPDRRPDAPPRSGTGSSLAPGPPSDDPGSRKPASEKKAPPSH